MKEPTTFTCSSQAWTSPALILLSNACRTTSISIMKVFLIGFMGSGKTHWGRLLADKMQLPFFDLDQIIAKEEDKTISDIFAERGEEYFRYKEKQVLEDLVSDHEKFI